jgi:hypothetical protein
MTNEQMSSDAAIDRVLTGLAGVEAPHEIEQRVLKAVQRRAAEQQGPRFAALSTLIHWQPWAVAACVVVLSFAASMAVRKRHEPRHDDAVLNQHTLPNVAAVPPSEVAKARQRQPAYSASSYRKNTAKPEAISDEEALAISEMLAPSKPAPPLPLTHQEKLLAEAVHQAGPTDLSSLRSEIRDRQMELSKAEFHDFFEPPPAKDNE